MYAGKMGKTVSVKKYKNREKQTMKKTTEFTPTAFILGILLAVVFGGANAYLGLRVGMTVSASIPAAVISMGIVRLLLKRDSILENNMVQTIGSAGSRWRQVQSLRFQRCLCGRRSMARRCRLFYDRDACHKRRSAWRAFHGAASPRADRGRT